MNPSSLTSVPAKTYTVNTCPDCAAREETAYCEANAPSEYDDWATITSDRMDKTIGLERIGDVLYGMGF